MIKATHTLLDVPEPVREPLYTPDGEPAGFRWKRGAAWRYSKDGKAGAPLGREVFRELERCFAVPGGAYYRVSTDGSTVEAVYSLPGRRIRERSGWASEPQLIVLDKLTGRDSIVILAGAFRFVCANGVVIGDGSRIRLRHTREYGAVDLVRLANSAIRRAVPINILEQRWHDPDVVYCEAVERLAPKIRREPEDIRDYVNRNRERTVVPSILSPWDALQALDALAQSPRCRRRWERREIVFQAVRAATREFEPEHPLAQVSRN